jgi:hypothetical protein
MVKPGHYEEVLDHYSNFAHNFIEADPHLLSVHIVGDPGSGLVRGIGIFDTGEAASEVNSDVIFARFNDKIADLISAPPERTILDLVHHWHR